METRIHIPLLLAVSALAAAGPASAKVYVTWKPRVSLFAGYNDNVLLDGSGADSFGQARPGVRLDLYGEHQLHVDLDADNEDRTLCGCQARDDLLRGFVDGGLVDLKLELLDS